MRPVLKLNFTQNVSMTLHSKDFEPFSPKSRKRKAPLDPGGGGLFWIPRRRGSIFPKLHSLEKTFAGDDGKILSSTYEGTFSFVGL